MSDLEGAKNEVINLMRTMAQVFISDEQYFENLEDADRLVKEQMEEDGEVQMAFLLHGRKRDPAPDDKDIFSVTIAVMADWPEDIADRKEEVMMGLGAEWVDKNPDQMLVQIVQVGEAWVSMSKTKDEARTTVPSKDPNRIECITVSTASIDQRTSQILYEIIRNEDGSYKELKTKMKVLYDPNDTKNSSVSYLILGIYKGYFLASDKAEAKKEEEDIKSE